MIEVLSDSTEAFDRGDKFADYKSNPAFEEYVLIHHQQILIMLPARFHDQQWRRSRVEEMLFSVPPVQPAIEPRSAKSPRSRQALPAKVFHWVNLVSLSIMALSGLQIYNANPVFGGREGWHFPPIGLVGGWLAGGRHWHFAAMWFFSLNLLWYSMYILITQRWHHRFVGEKDLNALQQSRSIKRRIYAWHRIAYTSIIPILLLAIFTGLGMYKPAQLYWIVDAFGGWFPLRVVHFITVPLVFGFALIHSWLALKAGGDRLVDSMFKEF